MQSVGGERNAYRRSLLWLVQYGTIGKCPSFCCKDFFVTILNFRFMLSLSSTQQFSSLPVLAITCDKQMFESPSENSDTGLCSVREYGDVCSAKNKEKRTKVKCRECNIGLCATPCFKIYHTKLHF
jgi:hypothetical protein